MALDAAPPSARTTGAPIDDKSGETVSKTVMVRSSQPFSITRLSTSGEELQTVDSSPKPGQVHPVRLTFKAPAQEGPHHATVTIETDIKDELPAQLKTFATVVP